MARISYITPVDKISGQLKRGKNSSIHRRKIYRDENGNIISEGTNEVYVITSPRDYNKTPLKGRQLITATLFGQAVALAKAERANPERLAYWSERFNNQLQKGEPDAPINPATGKPRIYHRLDIFIQSAIQRALRSGTWKIEDNK